MKFIFIFFVFFYSYRSAAQNYKFRYFLNEDFVSVKAEDAKFLGLGLKENGLFLLQLFNFKNSKMQMSLHFKDSSISTMHGSFTSFFPDGSAEVEGMYDNGIQDGTWTTKDVWGRTTDSTFYVGGKPMLYKTFSYNKTGSLDSYEITDSIMHCYKYANYVNGKINFEVRIDSTGKFLKKYNDNGDAINTVVRTTEKTKAGFPGGEKALKDYIDSHLNRKIPQEVGADPVRYIVILHFCVNADGSIAEINAQTRFGFGMEKEAIRLLKASQKWTPATVFGYPVKSYESLSFIF